MLTLALAVGVLGPAGPAQAARLEVVDTPSRYVDTRTATFANGAHPDTLRATVLLPDGYDGRRDHPVLYLIHPTGGDYRTWAGPEEGQITTIARGLDAIVVMPDAGLGFLTNWWNDGRRGDPGWERYYLDELAPLIERRFRVRDGRRWHAIAGYSMGGMGAPFLASQRPGYFGAAVSLSGFPSIQRPYLESVWQSSTGVSYQDLWGPSSDFYATGHNPAKLTDNLRHTRLFVSAGDGSPRPGVPLGPFGPVGLPVLIALEQESRLESDDLVAAARTSDVDVTYDTGDGVHDWPYIREDLKTAIDKWGLFEAVPEKPSRWTYRTVAQTGEAWGLRFAFAEPPAELETFRRDGNVLTGEGSGRLTITTESGCELTATLPFELELPLGVCTDGRLRLKVAPRRVRAGTTVRLRLRATTLVAGRRMPVAGARFRVGRRSAVAGRRGRARMKVRIPSRARRLRVRAAKSGLVPARTRLRVLRP